VILVLIITEECRNPLILVYDSEAHTRGSKALDKKLSVQNRDPGILSY